MSSAAAPRPYNLIAELTYRCPLRCAYCSNPLEHARTRDGLGTDDWCRVFREAAALGVVHVGLTGGEPTTRRDLPEIVAGAIYVLDDRQSTLEQVACEGLPQDAVREGSISAGEGRLGRVVSTGRPVISDVQLGDDSMTVHCVYPLNDRGEVRGLLEAYLSAPPDSVPGFARVLDVLTANAAATLRDAQELDALRHAVRAADESIDKMVDAWSQTLNCRDEVRRKHSLRAAELTLKTGRELGLSEEELIHARRGALLHDVGLTRVPESILQKPDRLTESDLVDILSLPEDSLLEEYRQHFRLEGVGLAFTSGAIAAIVREAARRPGGARTLPGNHRCGCCP